MSPTDQADIPLCTSYDITAFRRCGKPCFFDPTTQEYAGACGKHLEIIKRMATTEARRRKAEDARSARYQREVQERDAEKIRRDEVKVPLIAALEANDFEYDFTHHFEYDFTHQRQYPQAAVKHSVTIPEEYFDRLVKALHLLRTEEDSEPGPAA